MKKTERAFFPLCTTELFLLSQVMKIDTSTGDVISWKDPGHFVSEPIFVPRPGSTEEDDGVLVLTMLTPAALNSVQLVVLDAVSMEEVGRVAFRGHGTVTQGFHGIFVREDEEFHRY